MMGLGQAAVCIRMWQCRKQTASIVFRVWIDRLAFMASLLD
jgi:hypothetical protein